MDATPFVIGLIALLVCRRDIAEWCRDFWEEIR